MRLQDWAPLAGGVMILVFLGIGGEQTDVLAHMLGFTAGLCVGAFMAQTDRCWREKKSLQTLYGCLAIGVVALAWALAILRASQIPH